MNPMGHCMLLNERGGAVSEGWASGVGAVIKTALSGTLTVTGITNSGTPTAWTMNAASGTGYIAAPGSGHTGGLNLHYALSNAADVGKVLIFFFPA
jgi:hypothetical protein